jgi:benzaldehyde dehydrogenase (NAD)
LGGNSPFVVLEDADIEAAARCGAWGSFLHQGQICMASSRHLVHESIADAYAAALTAHAERLVVGDPAAGDVHVRWTTRAQSLDACEREWCISTIRR